MEEDFSYLSGLMFQMFMKVREAQDELASISHIIHERKRLQARGEDDARLTEGLKAHIEIFKSEILSKPTLNLILKGTLELLATTDEDSSAKKFALKVLEESDDTDNVLETFTKHIEK